MINKGSSRNQTVMSSLRRIFWWSAVLTSVCKQCIFRDHRITWQIEYLAYMNTVPDIYMWLTIPRLFTYNLQVLLESSLDAEVKQFKHRTFADSTKRTYASQRDSYLAFCNVMGYCAIPASPATLCRYAAMLARTLKISSVKHYLNVIRLLHLSRGHILRSWT